MPTIEHNLCGWGVSVGGHTTGRRVAWAEWVNLVLGLPCMPLDQKTAARRHLGFTAKKTVAFGRWSCEGYRYRMVLSVATVRKALRSVYRSFGIVESQPTGISPALDDHGAEDQRRAVFLSMGKLTALWCV